MEEGKVVALFFSDFLEDWHRLSGVSHSYQMANTHFE
jgi:hypothetical protein